MKKIISFLVISLITLHLFSQVKVVTTGQTIIGTNSGISPAAGAALTVNQGAIDVFNTGGSAVGLFERTDGAAMIYGGGFGNSGITAADDQRFVIGFNTRAKVKQRLLTFNGVNRLLMMDPANGGRVGIGVFTPSEKLHVSGNILATGMITPSDKRLKNNIEKFNLGLDEVLKINPASYNYNGTGGIQSDRQHVGVIAQEFAKIAPVAVKSYNYVEMDNVNNETSQEEYLSVDEKVITYMLVNAIKEQQDMIDSQNEVIEFLKESIENISSKDGSSSSTNVTLSSYDLAELGQNRPNPFSSTTSIDYIIPTDSESAKINIFGTNGQLIKSLVVSHKGQGSLDVNAEDLPSGTYSYQLLIDGRLAKTNKMTLIK